MLHGFFISNNLLRNKKAGKKRNTANIINWKTFDGCANRGWCLKGNAGVNPEQFPATVSGAYAIMSLVKTGKAR